MAEVKVQHPEGGCSSAISAKARKVLERGFARLIVNDGIPFAMQLSRGEAAAILGRPADFGCRYAIAFAIDANGTFYSSDAVGARSRKDCPGLPPTDFELVETAKDAAFRALFDDRHGRRPHIPLRPFDCEGLQE